MREEIREELSRWIRDEIKSVKEEIIFNLKKQLTEQVKESQVSVPNKKISRLHFVKLRISKNILLLLLLLYIVTIIYHY